MLSTRTFRAAWPILAVAVLLRSLVAGGYMPGTGGSMELCTSRGLVTVPLAVEPGAPAGLHGEQDSGPAAECPWDSALFTVLLLPVLEVLPAPVPVQPVPDVLASSHAGSLRTGVPPVRAPPSLLS